MVMCVSEGERGKGEELCVEEVKRRIQQLAGKKLALEKWSQRLNELGKEVDALRFDVERRKSILRKQEGRVVTDGVYYYERAEMERELNKLEVILRGKEKALADWRRKVERMRKEVEVGEKFVERLREGKLKICGEVVG